MEAGFIKDVKFTDWISNVVVIKKKQTGKWRVYADFVNLNKECLKDDYPILKIDIIIDAIAGHELLSMLNTFFGYNQVPLNLIDHIKMCFYHRLRFILLQGNAIWAEERRSDLQTVSEQDVPRSLRKIDGSLHRRYGREE